jgi:hypothetical protein
MDMEATQDTVLQCPPMDPQVTNSERNEHFQREPGDVRSSVQSGTDRSIIGFIYILYKVTSLLHTSTKDPCLRNVYLLHQVQVTRFISSSECYRTGVKKLYNKPQLPMPLLFITELGMLKEEDLLAILEYGMCKNF